MTFKSKFSSKNLEKIIINKEHIKEFKEWFQAGKK